MHREGCGSHHEAEGLVQGTPAKGSHVAHCASSFDSEGKAAVPVTDAPPLSIDDLITSTLSRVWFEQ